MAITRIKISNFRSFGMVDVRLGKLNVVIGPNASGKSNFVQVMRFLKDIATSGLEAAISRQGGMKYLRNVASKEDEPVRVIIHSDIDETFSFHDPPYNLPFDVISEEARYEIALVADGFLGYRIVSDRLEFKVKFAEAKPGRKNPKATGKLMLEKVGDLYSYGFSGPPEYDIVKNILNKLIYPRPPKDRPLLETDHFLVAPLLRELRNIGTFQLDRRAALRILKPGKENGLLEDGSNLPQIISDLAMDDEELGRLKRLVNYLIPYLTDLQIADLSLDVHSLRFKETYNKDVELPMELLSDGTIGVLQLVLVLFFDKRPIVIIEEPDLGIHPKLISRVVSLMMEATHGKQLIITTHSPEVVRHVDLKTLLFIKRDDRTGLSMIKRPSELETVRNFLVHDIGVDDLFVDGLLGG